MYQLLTKNRLLLIGFMLLGVLTALYVTAPSISTSSHPIVISHGGAFKTMVDSKLRDLHSTNSLEAMNANYSAGHRYFETDFEWTSDNQLVAIHDWKEAWTDYFGSELEKGTLPTLDTFMQTDMKYNLTQQTPSTINEWLDAHPDTYIITDIKHGNLAGLQEIMRLNSSLARERYIPQIYHFKEYDAVKELGFKRIILTLYQLSQEEADSEQILNFVKTHPLYGVTIHVDKARSSNIVPKLCEMGIFVYAHPIVEMRVFQELRKSGVYGVYSYTMKPSDFPGDVLKDHLPCDL